MTAVRIRDIAEMVIDEKIDDFKSIAYDKKLDVLKIDIIENQVN